jgi:hypothetical protein
MRRILFALALLPTAVLAQTTVLNSYGSTVNLPGNIHTVGDSTSPINPITGTMNTPVTNAPNANAPNANTPNANTPNANTPGGKDRQGQGTLKDESDGFASGATKTAADQGYVANNSAQIAQQQADYQALHTPRQLGEQVPEPAPFHPVSRQPVLAGWLANWSYTLAQAGVPATKVAFEANRLDQTAFQAWAYRQMLTVRAYP